MLAAIVCARETQISAWLPGHGVRRSETAAVSAVTHRLVRRALPKHTPPGLGTISHKLRSKRRMFPGVETKAGRGKCSVEGH